MKSGFGGRTKFSALGILVACLVLSSAIAGCGSETASRSDSAATKGGEELYFGVGQDRYDRIAAWLLANYPRYLESESWLDDAVRNCGIGDDYALGATVPRYVIDPTTVLASYREAAGWSTENYEGKIASLEVGEWFPLFKNGKPLAWVVHASRADTDNETKLVPLSDAEFSCLSSGEPCALVVIDFSEVIEVEGGTYDIGPRSWMTDAAGNWYCNSLPEVDLTESQLVAIANAGYDLGTPLFNPEDLRAGLLSSIFLSERGTRIAIEIDS